MLIKSKVVTIATKHDNLYTNFKIKNTFLPMFQPDAPVVFRAQVKFALETTLLIA